MLPHDERRDGSESENGDFDGRDLLVGRPAGSRGRRQARCWRGTRTHTTSDGAATPPQPDAHDDAIAEILATVRATSARIDALQDETGSAQETAEALARETAALTRAVTDARGALAKAAELAAGRDGAAETARSLAGAAAALKTQGETLDQRIRATDRQSAVGP